MNRLNERLDERGLLTALVVLLALNLGFLLGYHADQPASSPEPSPATSAAERSDVDVTSAAEPSTVRPERITIPAIDVDAPVGDLGLTPGGALDAPEDWSSAGWWAGGTAPGATGPAVIAGHVDSLEGPAVFFRLAELEPGDEIRIHGTRGDAVTYAVERIEQVPKRDFPTARVYGPTSEPTLRLITCGGAFDEAWGHYLDNVVVYARMTSSSASA